MCVRGCLPAHTGRLWLSVSTHRTSVGVRQHTHDVRVCPAAHTGRLWLSMCVRVCPSAHTGRTWLSISTHISTLVLGLSTLALSVDCLGDFVPRGLSVQYTQDVRGCPPAHTGRPWLSVAVHPHTQDISSCLCVSVSTHRTSVAVYQYTYQHVGPWTQHADPSRGLFGTSVCIRQHTQDVRGCLCLSVCIHQHTQDVSGNPSVHISARCTHRTFMGVRQHTQDVRDCLTLVLGLSTLALPMNCLGDFGPRGLSVQYTQDVRGCPPAHTGRPWLYVAVRQHTQDAVRTALPPNGLSQRHVPLGAEAPTEGRQLGGGRMLAFSPDSDLEAFSHNPAQGSFAPLAFQPSAMTNSHVPYWWVNNPTLGEFCFIMIGRADIEGSKSNVAMNAWLPRFHDVPPQQNSPPDNVLRPERPAEASLGYELALRKDPERAVPSPSPGQHEVVRSRQVSSSSSPPTVDRFETGTPEPSPQSQSFSRSYGSILPTSLAYIVLSTRGCSPWRPDAVMSTNGRERHSVLRIFRGRWECTGHHATCDALPAAGPYLR
ncbi:hypothetical protein YC2023_072359 [Brassica napus]